MTRPVPPHPSLEQYRKQAKDLVKARRAGDAEAIARIRRHHPRLAGAADAEIGGAAFALHDAQWVIAREYGFESWARFKKHLESLPQGAEPEALTEQFRRTVREGDAGKLRELLGGHPALREQIDAPLFDFISPAIIAGRRHRAVVEALLEHGADINVRSSWWAGGFGILDDADPETAAYLIERGARVDVHAAAGLGMLDRLRELVSRDPDLVHAPGGDGQRPLHFASTPEVVDFLLAHGAEIDARDVDHVSTAAQYAVPSAARPDPSFRRSGAKCRYLIERGAAVDIFMSTALGDVALVRSLLDQDPTCIRARVGRDGYALVPPAPGEPIYLYLLGINVSPHDVAAMFGHRAVYELLLERSPAKERLLAACWQGDETTVHALLKAQPDLARTLPPEDMRLISDAAWERNITAVRLMLDAGFDPHARGSHASTPLDRAAFHGFIDVVQMLLERDANPPLELQNEFGGTPLRACIFGSLHGWRKDGDHAATAEALIRAGAKLPEKASGSEPVREVLRRYGAPD